MISLKVLSAAAVLALALPAVMPTESFAQIGGGGAGPAPSAPAARGGGGGGRGAVAAPAIRGGGGGGGPRYSGGGGGHWAGGGGGGYRHGGGGGGGFIPGAIAGAVIGGAIASQGPYYGGRPYYGGNSYYYDDDYAEAPVQVAPGGGDDDVAYCMQTYRSYDSRSGTYMGNDGYRHPCP
jgi:hypothetical protein